MYSGTNPETRAFPERSPREAAVLAVLAILLGVWPPLLLSRTEPSVTGWVANPAPLKP